MRRVIEPILAGARATLDVMNDDLMYVRDLGLIAPDAPVRIANPIILIEEAAGLGGQRLYVYGA